MRAAVLPRHRLVPRAAPAARLAGSTSPGGYVARIDRSRGLEVPGPIRPEELLVGAHRDDGPAGIGAGA